MVVLARAVRIAFSTGVPRKAHWLRRFDLRHWQRGESPSSDLLSERLAAYIRHVLVPLEHAANECRVVQASATGVAS